MTANSKAFARGRDYSGATMKNTHAIAQLYAIAHACVGVIECMHINKV